MTFSEKLKQIRLDAEERENQVSDRKLELEEWQNSIKTVFENIRTWLTPFEKDIDISEHSVEITEEGLGSYKVPQLTVSAGSYQLVFQPYGVILIGTWGRIDVYKLGFADKGFMLLKFKNEKGEFYWEFRKKANSKEKVKFSPKGLEAVLNELL